MTTNEIIAMATEAGLNSYRIAPGEAVAAWERFAALVAAKEREACAQVCDYYATALDYGGNTYMHSQDCKNAATAIRSR